MDGAEIPHKMQLRDVLADQHGKDYLVAAGTGSGKTILDDLAKCLITITISPLKRLGISSSTRFLQERDGMLQPC